MAKKKLLASAALVAGLLGGGAAGFVLGVPGVSGAQTTTVPSGPSTTAPGGSQTDPDRPPRDGNCPNMGGGSTPGQAPGGSSSNSSTGYFRHGPRV